MRQALNQKSAAKPARVPFEVIENSTITESLPSFEDFAGPCPTWFEENPGVPMHMPGVFFFRKDLRTQLVTWDVRKAVEIGLAVCSELEQLQSWVQREFSWRPPRFLASRDEQQLKRWDEDAKRREQDATPSDQDATIEERGEVHHG